MNTMCGQPTNEEGGNLNMAKFTHGKYIVTGPKQNLVVPPWGGSLSPETATRVMYLDSEVIPGASYLECAWFWPTDKEDKGSPAPHKHDFDEVLGFYGTNPDDWTDLGAEIELWIGGEKNLMNKSFVAYIPAGTEHSPLKVMNVKRPVFHFASGQGKSYF
jgi:hypothetical protein